MRAVLTRASRLSEQSVDGRRAKGVREQSILEDRVRPGCGIAVAVPRDNHTVDAVDAEAAARAVMSGEATAIPKAGDGPVEALRQLRVARNAAIKAHTAAANQLHSLCDTAPDGIRSQLRGLSLRKKVAVAERWRPGTSMTVDAASKRSHHRRPSLAPLDAEVRQLDAHIKAVLDAVAARHLGFLLTSTDWEAQRRLDIEIENLDACREFLGLG